MSLLAAKFPLALASVASTGTDPGQKWLGLWFERTECRAFGLVSRLMPKTWSPFMACTSHVLMRMSGSPCQLNSWHQLRVWSGVQVGTDLSRPGFPSTVSRVVFGARSPEQVPPENAGQLQCPLLCSAEVCHAATLAAALCSLALCASARHRLSYFLASHLGDLPLEHILPFLLFLFWPGFPL